MPEISWYIFKPISPIPSFYWELGISQYKRNAAIFMAIGPDILINRSIRLEWKLGSHTTMHTNRSTYTFVRAHTNMQTQNRCSHMTVDGMQRRDIFLAVLVFQAATVLMCVKEREQMERRQKKIKSCRIQIKQHKSYHKGCWEKGRTGEINIESATEADPWETASVMQINCTHDFVPHHNWLIVMTDGTETEHIKSV